MYTLKAIARLFPSLYLFAYKCIHYFAIRDIHRIARQHKIDIIHLNDSPARDLLGVFVARKMKLPCLSHIRSAKMLSFPKPAQDFANTHICQYIAISDFIKNIWIGYGISKEKCTTIFNGIEPLKPLLKDYTSIQNQQTITFCTVGRLIKWKNQTWLLKSFKKYLATRPKAHLLIIGDGPDRRKLEKQAEQYELNQDHITFTGEIKNPYGLMSQSDIFVFPSRKEPFGRAVLEAMSLGMPIIASNSGGIPEFLKDNISGLLVPLNDIEALTNTMISLSSDGKQCQRLSQTAREHSEKHLSIKKTAQQIQTVYENCLTIT
ncbi:MAG: glycosyltransferase family 4 protein [Candidatus Paceibacterota bacterium]